MQKNDIKLFKTVLSHFKQFSVIDYLNFHNYICIRFDLSKYCLYSYNNNKQLGTFTKYSVIILADNLIEVYLIY